MRASEGVALIKQISIIGNVERGKAQAPILSKGFSEGQIIRGV